MRAALVIRCCVGHSMMRAGHSRAGRWSFEYGHVCCSTRAGHWSCAYVCWSLVVCLHVLVAGHVLTVRVLVAGHVLTRASRELCALSVKSNIVNHKLCSKVKKSCLYID